MIVAVSILAAPLIVYSNYVNSIPVLDMRTAGQLEFFAYSVILLMLVGALLGVLGLRRFLNEFRKDEPTSPRLIALIARVFEQKRYSRVMAATALTYGGVFAVISGMIVYVPSGNFSAEYLVRVPSAVIAVCCGNVGLIPVLTVLLTNQLGLLLIPADILILLIVSGLVGVNATLIVCQYDKRPRAPSGRWLLGLGAACGLFTACPTCAGLFLSTVVLGLGTSVLVLLSGLQIFFVLGTILMLIMGVYVSARILAP